LALFLLPFVTVLREGLEAVVFIGGVSLSEPGSSIPLAALCGIVGGISLGLIVRFSGGRIHLDWFFIVTSCAMFLLASGLLTRSIGCFEDYVWSQATNAQVDDVGTGLFDPRRIVWHLDCCNPEDPTSGWGIFNSLLGWRNNATYSTVFSYILFWVMVSVTLIVWKLRPGKPKDSPEFSGLLRKEEEDKE